MPLLGSFGAACARGLGLGNGEAPLAPSITTPASNDTTLGTAITAAIAYTITISTFPLARVEYKLDKIDSLNSPTDLGQWTGTLPGASGTNSATLSTRVNSSGGGENLLHAQKYALYLRAVDGAGQTGPESGVRRFTTGAEVAPTAAAPTLASTSVSGGVSPYIDITWAAGTAGTYSIATRQYSVVAGTGAAGTFTTVTGSTGTVRVTTTAAGASILPSNELGNATYRVYMKYIASTPTSPPAEATASTDITTAQEVIGNAITAQASNTGLTFDQHRTQFVISRGNVPNNTTYLQNYQYAYGTSINPTNWAYFGNYGFDSSVTIAGQTPDTTFYVRTRAISTVTSAAGTASGNASVQLNAALPPTPTIAFRSMSSSSYGTAQFTISGNGGSTDSVYIYRRPTSGTNTGATPVLKATGSQDISGYTSDGGTEYYVAYNFNRHSEASAPSNQIYWTRPTKNVSRTWRGNDAGQAYYFPDYTYVIKTNACEPYRLSHLFGPSGIPDSEEAPGYARIDRMQATFIPGTTLRRPSDNAAFGEASLANISTLRFSYGTANPGGTPTSSSSVLPTDVFGGALGNFGGATTVYRYVNVGGSALHDKVFWAEKSDLGKSWNSGCVLSTTGSYFAGKLFELVGVHTISGAIG